MPRRMSVAMTQQHVIGRTKTVTRRKGWWLDKHGRHLVKPGDHLILVDRVMGFKKGERATVLAEVEVVSVRRESLRVLADWCGDDEYREQCAEIRREGFDPDVIGPAAFVHRFFVKAQGMSFDDDVTRIEWRYLDDEADDAARDTKACDGSPLCPGGAHAEGCDSIAWTTDQLQQFELGRAMANSARGYEAGGE